VSGMNGWRLSWLIQSRRRLLAGELEIEIGDDRAPHIGMCLLENDGRQEEAQDHDWAAAKLVQDADGRDAYSITFEPGPGGARLAFRLRAQHEEDPDALYAAEVGFDFGSEGDAIAHDLWHGGALDRNQAPCGRRTTIDDGDVITLSRNRKFRLRLKRLPVIFVINCAGLTSEADVWREYLEVTQMTSGGNFGRNLDAFRDAIMAGGPGWPGACTLRFVGGELLGDHFHSTLRRIASELKGPVKLELIA